MNNRLKHLMFLPLMILPMQSQAQEDIERNFDRPDGAELNIIYEQGKPAILMLYVPLPEATNPDDNAIVIVEQLEKLKKGEYLLKEDETGNTWKVIEVKDSWLLECVEGDCYDKDNQKGIWKEPFVKVK